MPNPEDDAVAWFDGLGIARGQPIAIALRAGVGIGLTAPDSGVGWWAAVDEPARVVATLESSVGPRWVWWDRSTPAALADDDVRISRCWDVLTVHRLLRGGWRTSIAEVWAVLHDLPIDDLPTMGQLDLLTAPADEGDDPEQPTRPDGQLRPEWTSGGWATTPDRLTRWSGLAAIAFTRQLAVIDALPDPARTRSTAHSESLAEVLCAELTVDGLPLDVDEAQRIIADAVGPRPTDHTDEERRRGERDAVVLAHVPPGPQIDLRNPADVRSMLRRVSIDLPDTRAWRLEQARDQHPIVEALLRWRKSERIATTYGYRWLDEHVSDGRLRGSWTSSDGAAGRMTASAGLHNLPAELRPAVRADAGHVLVRADLGQVEPRVLAAVSGDPTLQTATAADDMYLPVAQRLRVERDVAKVAVLGAMYGATTGESAHALRGLEREYPVAMGFLEDAAELGRRGEDLATVGGRRVRMWVRDDVDGDIDRARSAAAARGRYARNAVIQGAAAEFFKVWAAIVRSRCDRLGARIVLCLHDELLVHAPSSAADAAAEIVRDAVDEAAYRWSPAEAVRFTADVAVIERWSDAKA